MNRFGYRLDLENKSLLKETGQSLYSLRAFVESNVPKWNVEADPLEGVTTLEDQGNLGSCVGNSVSSIAEACYFLATGQRVQLSRSAGYYLSQKQDGIKGDSGATISGAQRMATMVGFCLESQWPYRPVYDPREPVGCVYDYKLSATQPIENLAAWESWIELGLPIHVGYMHNDSVERDIVSNYNPNMRNSGGHAVMFWNKRNGNYRMINSWGRWNKDGQNEWTPAAIETMLANRWTVAIGYAPTQMMFPKVVV